MSNLIINLHGANGKNKNTNYYFLSGRYGTASVYSPQLDYENISLEDVLDSINGVIECSASAGRDLRYIVGNSFGGFVATAIAKKWDVPCILSNPCLRPDLVIDSIFPGYIDRNREIIDQIISTITSDLTFIKKMHIIAGTNDEVLNTVEMLRQFRFADIVIIPGNHRLSGQTYNLEFLAMEEKIEKSNFRE